LFDCTWSQAVNRNFVEYIGAVPQHVDEYPTRPTLPRWHEFYEPSEKVVEELDEVTKVLFSAAGIK